MSAAPLQPPERSAWRNPYGIALVGYYLVMAVVGMLVPDDILQANAWARDLSDFLASIVPQIDRITALNIQPNVNRFYFSALWASSPVLLGLLLLNVYRTRSALRRVWETPRHQMLFSVCGLAFMAAWTQQLWFVEPAMRLSESLFGSAVGRSFFAQLVFCIGAVFCIAGLMVWCLGFLSGQILSSVKEEHHV